MSIRKKLKKFRWQLASRAAPECLASEPASRDAAPRHLYRRHRQLRQNHHDASDWHRAGKAGRCRTKDDNGIPHLSRNLLSVGRPDPLLRSGDHRRHPGKIRHQTRILRPQIGVVTNVGGDHYANFRSLEATARERRRLVKDLPKTRHCHPQCRRPECLAHAKAHACARGVIRKQSRKNPNQTRRRVLDDFVLAAVSLRHCLWTDLRTCAKAIATAEPNLARYSVHQVPGRP